MDGQARSDARRILRYELIGFAVLIAISCLGQTTEWRVARIFATLLVAVPILLKTRSLMARRIVYLERLLKVCAWCGQVGSSDAKVTHGICAECAKRERSAENRNGANRSPVPLSVAESARVLPSRMPSVTVSPIESRTYPTGRA